VRAPALSNLAEPSPALHGDAPAAAAAQVLPDRSALALVAVERTRMPMVVSDPQQPDNPIVLANRAFLDLTGYSADEVLGRNCRFLQGEGTSQAAIDEIRQALRDEREIDVEILNYRKDGSAFWNQLSLSPVFDDDGRLLYVFGSQIDVTELRKVQTLEASEHRLLKEVDHRARNVLAVVGGIVRLSRADDPGHYAAAVQQRVQVLARAHSLLAERGWQEVALEQVIRQQIDGGEAQPITLHGPDMMISALIVQPLSLVIHELVDNARAHGALSVPAGSVEVQWCGRPEYGGFEIDWREVGGPAFSPDAPRGFGTAMISGMIEKQLRGQVHRAWTDGGLTVSITVPGTLEALQM
jgi:PAS domain S-box-containing protein